MLTASQVWTSPLQRRGDQVDQPGDEPAPPGSGLLDELRAARHREPGRHQPGAARRRGMRARASSTSIGRRSGADRQRTGRPLSRSLQFAASASYVTASHNVKAGFQYNWGPYENTRDTNADLQQRHRNGCPPWSVSPTRRFAPWSGLNADVGLYAQDSVAGSADTELRIRLVSHPRSRSSFPAGRFIGERRFDAIPMPVWKDFAPRFGVVYDLFGDAKTALKFGFNRYNESRTTQFATATTAPGAGHRTSTGGTSTSTTLLRASEAAYQTPGCEINFGSCRRLRNATAEHRRSRLQARLHPRRPPAFSTSCCRACR